MPTNFPTSSDNFTNPISNDSLNNPSHSLQHANNNDAIEAIEASLLPNGVGYGGLVLITPTSATNGTVNPSGTVTIGTAVANVTVSGVFSATYNAYKLQISGGVGSTAANCNLHLGAAGITGYYFGATETIYTSGAISAANGNNTTVWTCGNAAANGISLNCDIINPNLATKSLINYQFSQIDILGRAVVGSGILDNLTQHTAFTFTMGVGTITGGTIAVYGYRK